MPFNISKLRIGCINIRSLFPKHNFVKSLLDEKNISILGVTETWLTTLIDNNFLAIEGYNFFRIDRGREEGEWVYINSGKFKGYC